MSNTWKYTYKYYLRSTWNNDNVLSMKKDSAAERNKTVTVTIGPRTLDLLELVQGHMQKQNPGLDFPLTAVAGACMATGLASYVKSFGIDLARDWTYLRQ